MNDETADPNPTGRRWGRVVLGLSLALNLLVVGLAVGAALRFGGDARADRPPPVSMAALYRELPREDRHALREAMKSASAERRSGRRAEARLLSEALRADPFDAAAVRSVLSDQGAARAVWRDRVRTVWLERVTAMTEAERQAYADRLDHAMSHRRKGRSERDRDDRDIDRRD